MASTLTVTANAAGEQDPIVLRLPEGLQMDEDQFLEFCAENDPWKFERDEQGRIWIMSPSGFSSGYRQLEIAKQIQDWAKQNGAGVAVGADAGFVLPNGAIRSPDAAWISRERLRAVPAERKDKFLPLCPDFVVELRSSSDRLVILQAKMEEYIANGARLGWLIDPAARRVHVYRPGAKPQVHESPEKLSGKPELPGFALDFKPVWEPDI